MLKHGEAKVNQCTPEYLAWLNAKARCYYEKHTSYRRYGGRGIRVCAEWLDDFAAFLCVVGRRPSPEHSLDRFPDTNGDYKPGNVRWASPREQANNRRDNRLFEFDGERRTVDAWAREVDLPRDTIWKRINMGWSIARTLMTPVRRQANNVEGARQNNRWKNGVRSDGAATNRFYRFDGREMTLREWATVLGVRYHTLYNRIVVHGWPVHRAFTRPLRRQKVGR